jgi:DNA-binding XRE family transcriptional regulator
MILKTTRQLGTEVRRKRIALDLSQEELALVSRVSRLFVRHLEDGKPGCSLELTLKVLAALDMPVKVSGLAPDSVGVDRARKGRKRAEPTGG